MNLDFEKSLTYITKDSGWINKILAGGGIFLAIFTIWFFPLLMLGLSGSGVLGLTSFILCFVFAIILTLALAGFMAQTANRRINYQNSMLPDWTEFGRFIITGLKYFAGYFLYLLPVLLISSIFGCLLFTAIHGCPHCGLMNILFFIFLTLLGALTLMVCVLFMLFCPLMMANFFNDLKILSFVDFKNAFSLLKGNISNYLVLILLFIALSILLQFIFSVLLITIIGIILIPVIYFYLYLVVAELCAQFVLSAKNKD